MRTRLLHVGASSCVCKAVVSGVNQRNSAMSFSSLENKQTKKNHLNPKNMTWIFIYIFFFKFLSWTNHPVLWDALQNKTDLCPVSPDDGVMFLKHVVCWIFVYGISIYLSVVMTYRARSHQHCAGVMKECRETEK